jgi:hypothetical protein
MWGELCTLDIKKEEVSKGEYMWKNSHISPETFITEGQCLAPKQNSPIAFSCNEEQTSQYSLTMVCKNLVELMKSYCSFQMLVKDIIIKYRLFDLKQCITC